MAEQEVRPKQLSIAEIARLWSAETGDDAEALEHELAEWAYAAAADGARIGRETGEEGPDAQVKLKVEPDPQRQLCWEDLEAFCRARDRLVPHFWPGTEEPPPPPPTPADAGDTEIGSDEVSRLVVRAMDRMGKASVVTAESGSPGAREDLGAKAGPDEDADSTKPAAGEGDSFALPRPAVASFRPRSGNLAIAASRDEEPTSAARSFAASAKPEIRETPDAGPEGEHRAKAKGKPRTPARLDATLLSPTREAAQGPRYRGDDASSSAKTGHTPVVKVIRSSKKRNGGASPHGRGSERQPEAQEVPVRVMRPAPSMAPPAARASGGGWPGILGGVLCGMILAGAAGAVWLETKGPGLRAFLLEDQMPGPEVAALEQRASEAAARADEATAESERLAAELADTRRQMDTLRARIADISSLGERLTQAQRTNRELRSEIRELNAALEEARAGSGAPAATGDEVAALRKELAGAQDALQSAQQESARLSESLAAAQGELEAEKLDRAQLEHRVAELSQDLAAARDEIDNLTQSGAATQAVVGRLEGELGAAREELSSQTQARNELEAKVADLNTELTRARARLEDLTAANAAAERETRRLGKSLDAAKADTAAQRSAAKRADAEIARLTTQLATAQKATSELQAQKQAAEERSEALEKDLSLALKANTDLRAEAEGLDTQAAQLTEALATTREETATLKADRNAAVAKAETQAADLAKAEDEVETLRAAVEGSNSETAQLTARLAEAQRRAASLGKDRDAALARIDAMNQELADTRQNAEALEAAAKSAVQDAGRLTNALAEAERQATERAAQRDVAQDRLEALIGTLAAARAELEDLRGRVTQAEAERDSLLEAVEGWKAEAKVLAASLKEAESRAARAAGLKTAPQAGETKEDLIARVPDTATGEQKLAEAGVTQLAKADAEIRDTISRGDEFLSLGDVASARQAYQQAAELGDAEALTAMARTYDPRVLQGLGVLKAFANPDTATRLYERALAAGDSRAGEQLRAMQAWLEP